MKKLLLPLLLALLTLSACGPELQTGDLIFLRGKGDMSGAISASTGEVTHVGIVLCTDSGTYVLDATPERGVALTPMRHYPRPYKVVRPQFEYNKVYFDNEVRMVLGTTYDSTFLPGNMSYYCSELVWDLFRTPMGRPIVPTTPMTFLDADGQLPDYWADWFAHIDRPVPEGVPGTNPQDLYLWITQSDTCLGVVL